MMFVLVAPISGQAAPVVAGDEVSFEREWEAQAVPFYRVTVRGDGTGTVITGRSAAAEPETTAAIRVSMGTRDKLFAVEEAMHREKGCEMGTKKMAQTGRKTLTLRREGVALTCTFNYSDDKRMQEAVMDFGAIEATVEEGRKLAHLRRFDRLGLDAEVGSFTEAVKAGRAIELGNIVEILRTLAGDGDLMERVRARATDLLAMAEAGR